MTREHTDFIQAQFVAWERTSLGSSRPDFEVKRLSYDPKNYDLSAIVRYPPGWHTESERLSVDEEIFVLDGVLEADSIELTPDCYAYWPRGAPRPRLKTMVGATVLTFINGYGNSVLRMATAMHPVESPIHCLNVREGVWKADVAAMGLTSMATSARIRTLRVNEAKGEITYISAAVPYWRESQPEKHPVSQEFFMLAGEVSGPTGVIRQGGYVWRPSEVEHGPYGSLTGAVMLFRSTGGKFATKLLDPVSFSFSPEHRPIVPQSLREAAMPFKGFERY